MTTRGEKSERDGLYARSAKLMEDGRRGIWEARRETKAEGKVQGRSS